MYKFTIYRHKKGNEHSNADPLVQQLTCEYGTIASLVERLKAQQPEYDYYFMRKSGFISRLEYCKEEIKRAYEQLPATAKTESGVYITAWLNSGCITWNEAEQLREYNAGLARNYAKKRKKGAASDV